MDWASITSTPLPLQSFPQFVGGDIGFAAVGRSGNIAFSTNGTDWFPVSAATRNNFRAVAHHEDRYVAVGNDGKIVTSRDGTDWTLHPAGVTNDLRAIAAGLGRWVAVGQDGVQVASTNGVDWAPGPGTGSDLFGLAFGANQFVAVGEGGVILRSPNGLDWQNVRAYVESQRLHGITRGPDLFVATGRDGNTSLLLTSSDGIGWTSHSVLTSSYLENVTFGNGFYLAVGSPGVVLVSTNGIDWTDTTPPLDQGVDELDWVATGNGTFLIVGYNGWIMTSSDAAHWSKRYSGFSSRNLRSVTYANGVFTAVGNNDTILQSESVLPRLTANLRSQGFEITLFGEANRAYIIQASTNLTSWSGVATLTNAQTVSTWLDTQSSDTRFYRALTRQGL